MSGQVLISALPGEVRIARIESDRLEALEILRADKPALAGSLFRGRVTALDTRLTGAFVEIGLARPGFLPLGEAPKGLSAGDAVTVRVTRDPGPDKGTRLSARTGSLPAELAEAESHVAPPALLRVGRDPQAALRELAEQVDAPEEIVIDDPETYALARRLWSQHPVLSERLRLDREPRPLFERAGLEAEIETLLQPEVPLPSGARLLVEPVRTLTAIDVDTTRADARRALEIDLEAAAEIPRQLRLRALAGLIVVDFLELQEADARKRVTDALKRSLRKDLQPGWVQPMRPSGLVELTRRRAAPALYELLTEPCAACLGGRAPDPVARAFAALRALRAESVVAPGKRPAIVCAPAIARALETGPAAAARTATAGRLGFDVAVRPTPGQADVEIVLE